MIPFTSCGGCQDTCMVMDVALILSAFNPIGGEGTGEGENITILVYINVKSTDHLYVDKIGRNHLDVRHYFNVSHINIKTCIVLLSHLNRLNNMWVGSIFTVHEIVTSNG